MSDTAVKSMMSKEADYMNARRSADHICQLLRDFIPHHCSRDAWERVTDACLEHGFELTSRAMRKEYEAWKSTRLDILKFDPMPPRQSDAI